MIRSLFRFMFKAFYGISALVGGLIIALAIFIYVRSGESKIPPVPSNALLTVQLKGSFAEHEGENLLQDLLANKSNSLFSLSHGLYHAADDSNVKAVLIYIAGPQLGLAQAQEIRQAILYFRSKGKKVYAFADTYGYGETGNTPYYLASACDQIWMQPMGTVGLTGIQLQIPFLKGLLEELSVQPEFGQRKEYKTMPELFTHRYGSPENTEVLQAIADSFMSQIVEGVSKGRNLSTARTQNLINNGPYLMQEAITSKLIDRAIYREQLRSNIQKDLGYKVETYTIAHYATHILEEDAKAKGDKVAVIFDSGMILREGQAPNGSESAAINSVTHSHVMKAIKNKSVKAIVYRINSPGGDPSASQSIAHILQHAKEQGKPVIISMSDMAASGGYWISCVGTKIVAQPGTLTGSIGVYAGKFALKDLWERIGVNWDSVHAGENGGMWGFNDTFTPHALVKLNQYLDDVYDRFVGLVSKARDLPLEKVEKVAKGRAWTGEQAQALGLVDQLGGLEDAVRLARIEAKLPKEAPVVVIPKPKTLSERIIALISGEDEDKESDFIRSMINPLVHMLSEIHFMIHAASNTTISTDAKYIASQTK